MQSTQLMAKDTSNSTGRLTCGYYWHFDQLEEQTKLPPETGTCSLASPNLRTMLGPNSHLPNSYTIRLSCICTNHPNSLHLSWPPPHENTQHFFFSHLCILPIRLVVGHVVFHTSFSCLKGKLQSLPHAFLISEA